MKIFQDIAKLKELYSVYLHAHYVGSINILLYWFYISVKVDLGTVVFLHAEGNLES